MVTSFLRGPAALVLRLSCRDEIADDQNGFAATHERSTGPQRVRLARLRGTWTIKDLVSECPAESRAETVTVYVRPTAARGERWARSNSTRSRYSHCGCVPVGSSEFTTTS